VRSDPNRISLSRATRGRNTPTVWRRSFLSPFVPETTHLNSGSIDCYPSYFLPLVSDYSVIAVSESLNGVDLALLGTIPLHGPSRHILASTFALEDAQYLYSFFLPKAFMASTYESRHQHPNPYCSRRSGISCCRCCYFSFS